MEVDHVLLFTNEAAQVAAAMMQFGLSEGSPNVHAGQGTACRRFFFNNAYLEFAWVTNEEEVKNPSIDNMKLWQRSQYRTSSYCPFGICFRLSSPLRNPPALIFEDGWKYFSPFLPQGQFANIAANSTFSAEPILFEMPFFGIAPKNYAAPNSQPLVHEKGFTEITKVILTLPVAIEDLSPAMKKVVQQSIVDIAAGENYAIAIVFDDGVKGASKSFYPLIPLTFRW